MGTCFHFLSKGLGKTDDELEAWIIDQAPCMVIHIFGVAFNTIESNCSYFCCPSISEAFRGHQVLLSHAKAKRKGGVFTSPDSKSAQKLHNQILILHLVGNICFLNLSISL